MTELLGLAFCAAVLLLEALHRRERVALLMRRDAPRPKGAKQTHASAHRRAIARQKRGNGHESV